MDLKTKDGFYFISESDFKIFHDIVRTLPELKKSVSICMTKIDTQIASLSVERDSLAKFRRMLNSFEGYISLLGKVEEKEKVTQ